MLWKSVEIIRRRSFHFGFAFSLGLQMTTGERMEIHLLPLRSHRHA